MLYSVISKTCNKISMKFGFYDNLLIRTMKVSSTKDSAIVMTLEIKQKLKDKINNKVKVKQY